MCDFLSMSASQNVWSMHCGVTGMMCRGQAMSAGHSPMKLCWLLMCLLSPLICSFGQTRTVGETFHFDNLTESAYLNNHEHAVLGLRSDPQTYHQYTSPWSTFWPGSNNGISQPYWLGSTTTQSFNKGKFGTIYYYDMLGNMRNARTFIDIAGKNKRGLKLLLPTLNQRMFR